jgi:hypothetical protein
MSSLLHRRRSWLVVALGALAGLAAAFAQVGGKPGELTIGAAVAHVLVDMPPPSVVQRVAAPADLEALTKRAELLGRVMVSRPAVEQIARRIGRPPDDIGALARDTGSLPHALTEDDSEERAFEIVSSKRPYRLEVQARPTAPVLDIYAQGPSTSEAERLADAAARGLDDHLRDRARAQGSDEAARPRLRELGHARGAAVHTPPVAIAVLTFLVVLVTTSAALLGLLHLHRRVTAGAPARVRRPSSVTAVADDDWPHTSRLLPWMLAVFLALLWLVPFNEIQLSASLPIDLKLDRLVLPFVAAIWVLAWVGGGAAAPRVRFTWIHAAVAAFVTCAFLSVVLDARYLDHTLELDQSFKRLPLLVAYVSLFFIAASTVRRSEVRAFLTFTLGLAATCAVGMLWEYRFDQNLFYDVSDALLPGIFSVGAVDPAAVDEIGRRVVRGPAAVPLEAVAMLSMALPIGLVWLMQARTRGRRTLIAIAVCLLLAAMIATYRKSALLIPASVVLTLAYFRRRELLRLAPLALVLVLTIHVLAPGALGATVSQLDVGRLGVATVSDRAVDYDAVRPDVWSHLLLGRGWGTYDFVDYRILDSEILQRTIEMGVLGLVAYLLMGVSVIATARGVIASRDRQWAGLALVGAAAAVAFLIASTLFDIVSFPHDTYIFLYMAGLVAVVVGPRRERAPDRLGPAHAVRVRPLAREEAVRRAHSTTHPHQRTKTANAAPTALRRP